MSNEKNVRRDKSKKKKKKFSFKVFACFLIFEVIFTGATAPFIAYYGPFTNVRDTLVGAAMTTLSHQWIAKAFLSQEKIDEILKKDTIEVASQNLEQTAVVIDDKKLELDDEIERYEVKNSKFVGNVLIVHNPKRVRIGYTKFLNKEGQLTSQIAEDNDAVAAVNGGGFVDKSSDGYWTGTGGIPVGLIMHDGEVKFKDMDESAEADTVGFREDGMLVVGKYSINQLKGLKVRDALTFGPALVVDGQGTIKSGDGGWGIAPRTAIGQRKDGAIILLTIDGRQIGSLGATLKDVQEIMLEYEAVTASNLDGGSSSTMYYNGEIINNPSDALGERYVASAIYVTP